MAATRMMASSDLPVEKELASAILGPWYPHFTLVELLVHARTASLLLHPDPLCPAGNVGGGNNRRRDGDHVGKVVTVISKQSQS